MLKIRGRVAPGVLPLSDNVLDVVLLEVVLDEVAGLSVKDYDYIVALAEPLPVIAEKLAVSEDSDQIGIETLLIDVVQTG